MFHDIIFLSKWQKLGPRTQIAKTYKKIEDISEDTQEKPIKMYIFKSASNHASISTWYCNIFYLLYFIFIFYQSFSFWCFNPKKVSSKISSFEITRSTELWSAHFWAPFWFFSWLETSNQWVMKKALLQKSILVNLKDPPNYFSYHSAKNTYAMELKFLAIVSLYFRVRKV